MGTIVALKMSNADGYFCGMDWVVPKHSIAFKVGKLYVFSPSRIIVIKGWPHMEAWTRTKTLPWRRFRPHIHLRERWVDNDLSRHKCNPEFTWFWEPDYEEVEWHVARGQQDVVGLFTGDSRRAMRAEQRLNEGPDDADEDDGKRWPKPRAAFFDGFPEEVRNVVAAFPHRHWHLLSMVARCERGLEFLKAHPALGFALASHWVFRGKQVANSMRWIRRMMECKLRKIAAELGFKDSESTVRQLGKMEAASVSVGTLFRLRSMLQGALSAKFFSHAEVIDDVLISLVYPGLEPGPHRSALPPHHWLTLAFLQRMARSKPLSCDRRRIPKMFEHYFSMVRELGVGNLGHNRIHDVEEFIQEHRRVTAGWLEWALPRLQADYEGRLEVEREEKRVQSLPFPAPPFPGNDYVVPITTREALVLEGKVQSHCVGTMASSVVFGENYFYQVLAPERATLCIKRIKGRWQVDELLKAKNKPVSEETRRAVNEWLNVNSGLKA